MIYGIILIMKPKTTQVMLDEMLADSKPADIWTAHADGRHSHLGPEQVRRDISIFIRAFTRFYIKWPFLSKWMQRKIITACYCLYTTQESLNSGDIFESLAPILARIDDGHLMFRGSDQRLGQYDKVKKYKFIGDNFAGDAAWRIENVLTPSGHPITVVGIKKLNDYHYDWSAFKSLYSECIKRSIGLILDVRGNHGGSPEIISWLSNHLMGQPLGYVDSYIWRGTPEVSYYPNWGEEWNDWMGFQSWTPSQKKKMRAGKMPDPWTEKSHRGTDFKADTGYNHPIIILQDRQSASSGERAQEQLSKHPDMIIMGDNSAGCRMWTWSYVFELPNSGIKFRLGSMHLKTALTYPDMVGIPPNIRVPKGRDALDMAMKHMDHRIK